MRPMQHIAACRMLFQLLLLLLPDMPRLGTN
jgi:hypothetical protein